MGLRAKLKTVRFITDKMKKTWKRWILTVSPFASLHLDCSFTRSVALWLDILRSVLRKSTEDPASPPPCLTWELLSVSEHDISLSESPLSRLGSAESIVELSSAPSVPCESRVESSDSTLKLKIESPARTSFMSCFVIRVASLEPPSGMVFKLVISSRSFAPALAHTAPVQSNECFLFCNFKEKNWEELP